MRLHTASAPSSSALSGASRTRAITGARYDTLAVNSLATVQVALIRSL